MKDVKLCLKSTSCHDHDAMPSISNTWAIRKEDVACHFSYQTGYPEGVELFFF